MNIYLVGYVPPFYKKKHTNFWPWSYLAQTFRDLGLNSFHANVDDIDHAKPHVYICWNQPDSIELIQKYSPNKASVIIQKLTSFDGSPESANMEWTDKPLEFFQKWKWPQYQKLETLEKTGYSFYAFGARTVVDIFPEKKRIVDRYRDRIFWIPWGTMTVPYEEIQRAHPISSGFEYDLGFVGSRWGTKYRGNILEWDTYLHPLIDAAQSPMIAGRGTKVGAVTVKRHIEILKKSKLCPIIHATSWRVERGVMDRFWTVFSLGRFGVIDNVGILDFFNEDEIVLAVDPKEYVEKSIYYMKNTDKQIPYIEKVLARIKKEYNQREVWRKIWRKILFEQ